MFCKTFHFILCVVTYILKTDPCRNSTHSHNPLPLAGYGDYYYYDFDESIWKPCPSGLQWTEKKFLLSTDRRQSFPRGTMVCRGLTCHTHGCDQTWIGCPHGCRTWLAISGWFLIGRSRVFFIETKKILSMMLFLNQPHIVVKHHGRPRWKVNAVYVHHRRQGCCGQGKFREFPDACGRRHGSILLFLGLDGILDHFLGTQFKEFFPEMVQHPFFSIILSFF